MVLPQVSDDGEQRAQELIDDWQRKTFAWSLGPLWCSAVCFWFTFFITQISEPQSMKQLNDWTQQLAVKKPTGNKHIQFLQRPNEACALKAHAKASCLARSTLTSCLLAVISMLRLHVLWWGCKLLCSHERSAAEHSQSESGTAEQKLFYEFQSL